MTESPAELAAVEQLLAEGEALRGWLARLDQASNAAPDAVRQRVRDDYQRRLDEITAGLRAHADVVASKLDDDRAERDELQSRATQARDALVEAELRHAVGEYDRDRFESEHRRHSSDLETYELSLAAAAERIARLEAVHSLVNGSPRPPVIDFEPLLPESVAPEPPEVIIAEPEFVPIADLAPDADAALAIFDEPAVDDDAAPQTPLPETGPLSFRPSGQTHEFPRQAAPPAQRPRSFDSAPPLGIPAADVPPRFVRPGERFAAAPAPPAMVSPVSELAPKPEELFAEEIVATGPAPEASQMPVGRTLRCGECGAMNRPLEWYCEKCGAELTAV